MLSQRQKIVKGVSDSFLTMKLKIFFSMFLSFLDKPIFLLLSLGKIFRLNIQG